MDIDPYDQFLFEPDEIQSCIQPMAFGATFPFNTCKIEGFQPAVDGGSGSSSDNLVSHCNLTNNLEGDMLDFVCIRAFSLAFKHIFLLFILLLTAFV